MPSGYLIQRNEGGFFHDVHPKNCHDPEPSHCARHVPEVTKDQQKTREAAVEASTQADFVPVFRFAVASDVHISAGDQTNTERFRKLFDSVYRYTDGHPTYNLLTDDFMRTAASTDGGIRGGSRLSAPENRLC